MFAGTHSRDLCTRGSFASPICSLRAGRRSRSRCAGLTLGFFAWYAVIVPHHHGCLSEVGLFAGLVAGLLVRRRYGWATRTTFRAEPE